MARGRLLKAPATGTLVPSKPDNWKTNMKPTLFTAIALTVAASSVSAQKYDPTAEALKDIAKIKVGPKDWPQWGGWH